MNKGFYKNLDKNFEEACWLSERDFSHEELVNMLEFGNIPQKQIAALKFDRILARKDAEILVNNLTGCDGKIREAVALKIYNLASEDSNAALLLASTSPKTFADATIDINANICRLVVDSANILKKDSNFSKIYSDTILEFATNSLNELDKFIFRDKKYVINKQLFKLYWCLESLKNFYDSVDKTKLIEILKRSANQTEYTIREKAAQLSILSEDFVEIQNLLKNDTNYYVKSVFLNHHCCL